MSSKSQVDLTLRIGSNTDGLKSAATDLEKFFARFKGNLASGLGFGAGFSVANLAAGAVTAVVRELQQYAAITESIVRETERSRSSIGLTATGYQVFANTLASANQDVGALNPAMSNLSRTIGEAATGSSTAAGKLAAIGLTFQQLKGLSPERQLELVARRIAALSDANERDAATADLLGRSYQNLKPLLQALARDGYDGLTASVEASTGIIKDDLSKSIDDSATRSENAGKRIAASLAKPVAEWKKMLAYSKEYMANLIAGSVAPIPIPSGAILSARDQAKGLNPGEIEALLSKELSLFSSLSPSITSAELAEISDRVKVFEEALATSKANALAAEIAANPYTSQEITAGIQKGQKARAQNELDFQKRLKADILKVGASTETNEQQQRSLKFGAEQADLARQLAGLDAEVARIEANRFLLADQKSLALQPLLQKENALIAARVVLLNEELKTNQNLTQAEKQQIQDRIDQLTKEQTGIQTKQTGAQVLGPGAQMSADIVKLRDGWSTAKQISNAATSSIQTGVDGISDSVYGLITKTKNLGLVWLQAGASILQTLIKTGVQIGVNNLLGLTAQKSQAAGAATTGPAIAASYAPAAAASSIASYGSAAVVGAAAAGVAIGLIIAMLSKNAFADGGAISGPGTGRSDSILARVSNGEYVVNASSVRALGLGRLDYINRTGRLPGYADGGPINLSGLMGQGAGSSSPAQMPPMYFYIGEDDVRRAAYARGHFDANVQRVLIQTSYQRS